ncbi:hypothetical protein [Mucilaginibacter puniceus]
MYRKVSFILGITGIVAIIIGQLFFTDISTLNAVDSHSWGISLNGIKSFNWPDFLGFEMLSLVAMIYFTIDEPKRLQFS